MEEKLFEPDYSLETPQEKAKRLGTTTTKPDFCICHICGSTVRSNEVHTCSSGITQLNS